MLVDDIASLDTLYEKVGVIIACGSDIYIVDLCCGWLACQDRIIVGFVIIDIDIDIDDSCTVCILYA